MASRTAPDTLEILLSGISALANRLKKHDRTTSGRKLPLGGKQLLRTLVAFGPQTVPQLARLHASSRQNIQVLVNKLVAARCVTLADNPAHKSSRLVALTDVGRARLSAAAQHEAKFLSPLVARITAGEIAATQEIIARMRALLEGRPIPEIKPPPAPRVRITVPRRPASRVAPVQEAPPAAGPIEPADDGLPLNLL